MIQSDHLLPMARAQGRRRLHRRSVAAQPHQPVARRRWTLSPSSRNQYWGVLQPLMRWAGAALPSGQHGIRPDYARSYWTPPLTPTSGLRPGAQPDRREATAAGDGLAHRPRQHPGADAAAHASPRARQIPVSLEWSGALRSAAQSPSTWASTTCPAPRGAEWMAAHGGVHGQPGSERPASC